MNIIFTLISFLSILLLTFKNPESILEIFSSSTQKAVNLSITLIAVYAVWLGIIEILNATKLNKKIANFLKPLISKLFNTEDPSTVENLSICFASNLLGLGGVATPLAIDSMKQLEEQKNYNGQIMLFVISASSIQIFPLSVIQLLAQNGASNPYDIFIPSLIASAICTIISFILVKVFT